MTFLNNGGEITSKSLLLPKYQITSRSCSDGKKTSGSGASPLPDSDAVIFIGLGDNAVNHEALGASKHQDGGPRQQTLFSKRTPSRAEVCCVQVDPAQNLSRNSGANLQLCTGPMRISAPHSLSSFPTRPPTHRILRPEQAVENKKPCYFPPDTSRDKKQRQKGEEMPATRTQTWPYVPLL